MADLLMDFESIGGGCEFGMVQRCCGAEPLGLLRFTGAAVDNLIQLLEGGLADFLTPEDVGIDVHGDEREYLICSRRFGDFFSHTNTFVGRHEKTEVLAREIKKVAYLKRRFDIDWREAARVYVHCGCEDEATILRLHAALRAKSDCVLLWVMKARSPEERGRIEVRAPGLLRGFLAHHGTFEGGPRFDLPGWAMVCRAADAIVHGLTEPPPPSPNPIDATFAWSPTPYGTMEAGPTRGRFRVLHATTHKVAVGEVVISARIQGKSLVVFSVWVRLSASFRGTHLELLTDVTMLVNYRRSDFWRHDTWQQVWVVAKVVEPRETLRCTFYVEAAVGSDFEFGGWQLEEGAIPDEGLRPSEAALLDSFAQRETRLSFSHRTRVWLARALAQVASRVRPPEQSILPSVDGLTGDALLRTADTLLKTQLFDEADGILRAGKFLFPRQAELFTHYALCAQNRGDPAEAARRWRDVVDLFPEYALGHYRLAENLRECGEYDRALAVIENALPGHTDDVGMVSEAARVFAASRRWPEAVAQWNRAIAMAGERPEWRKSRAIAVSAAAFLSSHADQRPVPPS